MMKDEQDDLEFNDIDIEEVTDNAFKLTINATNDKGEAVKRELVIDRSQAEAFCQNMPSSSKLYQKTMRALGAKKAPN